MWLCNALVSCVFFKQNIFYHFSMNDFDTCYFWMFWTNRVTVKLLFFQLWKVDMFTIMRFRRKLSTGNCTRSVSAIAAWFGRDSKTRARSGFESRLAWTRTAQSAAEGLSSSARIQLGFADRGLSVGSYKKAHVEWNSLQKITGVWAPKFWYYQNLKWFSTSTFWALLCL